MCKHCNTPIVLQPLGPGQVWVHTNTNYCLCYSYPDIATTWAEPMEMEK